MGGQILLHRQYLENQLPTLYEVLHLYLIQSLSANISICTLLHLPFYSCFLSLRLGIRP